MTYKLDSKEKTSKQFNQRRTFVVGDTHGRTDMKKINKWYGKNIDKLTQDDVVIQLGDWGALWYYKNDVYKYKKDVELQIKWAKKKFTLAVVLGNHENYDLVEALPIEEKWGGKVRVLTPKNPYNQKTYGPIYLLERGEIYTINGKTFLALGGAKSQDLGMRILGESYWDQELWTSAQENNCIDNLDKVDWEVDYVVAHTCPEVVGNIILDSSGPIRMSNDKYFSSSAKVKDPLSKFFTFLVNDGLKFDQWHFGHWHEDTIFNMYNQDLGIDHLYQCHYLKEPFELNKR